MAILPADLRHPTGELRDLLFPGDDSATITTNLQAYITEGEAQAAALTGTEQDTAVRAWAYHRAYLDIWLRLSGTESTAKLDGQGSSTFKQSQIDAFALQASSWLEQFEELVPPEAPEDVPPTTFQGGKTTTTTHRFTW